MNIISSNITYDLGKFKDETIFLHCTAIPDWNSHEKFVLELFYKDLILPDFEEKKKTIARIDNKSHGSVHLDREFKENPDKVFRDWTIFSAWEFLEDNWREFTNKYFRNHGEQR